MKQQHSKKTVRTCVSCRASGQKSDLIRVVRKPDGEVVVDVTGKMPGRGAYLCGSKECTEAALKFNKLGRALRCDIPQVVRTEIENLTVKNDGQ